MIQKEVYHARADMYLISIACIQRKVPFYILVPNIEKMDKGKFCGLH